MISRATPLHSTSLPVFHSLLLLRRVPIRDATEIIESSSSVHSHRLLIINIRCCGGGGCCCCCCVSVKSGEWFNNNKKKKKEKDAKMKAKTNSNLTVDWRFNCGRWRTLLLCWQRSTTNDDDDDGNKLAPRWWRALRLNLQMISVNHELRDATEFKFSFCFTAAAAAEWSADK